MYKIMNKEFTNADVLNIVGYAENEKAGINKMDSKFSMEFIWKFRKNIKKLRVVKEEYDTVMQELANSFSTDEKSHVTENGSRILNDEYIDEYNARVYELFTQKNNIDIETVPIDHMIVGGADAMKDVNIAYPELELLMFMIDDGADEVEVVNGTVEE